MDRHLRDRQTHSSYTRKEEAHSSAAGNRHTLMAKALSVCCLQNFGRMANYWTDLDPGRIVGWIAGVISEEMATDLLIAPLPKSCSNEHTGPYGWCVERGGRRGTATPVMRGPRSEGGQALARQTDP